MKDNGGNKDIRGFFSTNSGPLPTEIMDNQPPILDDSTEQTGRDSEHERGDDEGVREPKSPIEMCGKLLNDEQRRALAQAARKCYSAAQTSNGVWIQDIVLCGTNERAGECASYIRRRLSSYTRSVFIISTHDAHVHVLHDCNYHSGTCRCWWKKETATKEGFDFRRRLKRQRRRRIRELQLSDWEYIMLYFSTEGRRQAGTLLNGEIQTFLTGTKDLAMQRLERPRRKAIELVGQAEQDLEGDPDDLRQFFEDGESSSSYGGSSNQVSRGTKRKRQEDKEIFSGVQSLLQRFPVAPLINIADHPVYLESPWARYRSNNLKYQDAIDVFQKKLMRYSIEEYMTNIYNKPDCIPIFRAGHTIVDDYYYNLEDSIDIMIKLLNFQFAHDEGQITYFMQSLYDIVNRNIPKCNSLIIHSPHNAGKNFFLDTIIDYCLSRGQLGQANRHNQFAFQDAYGKRIILWDEPNYESSMTDQLKMMLGGGSYTVRVKGKHDHAVYRTPMILLTNNPIPLLHDPAFKTRMRKFTWKAAPMLESCTKFPYPLAIYHLFVHYGIIKE